MHPPSLSGWVLIIIIALFVFGPKKLPEIGKTLGRTLREFRNSAEGLVDSKDETKEETCKKQDEKNKCDVKE